VCRERPSVHLHRDGSHHHHVQGMWPPWRGVLRNGSCKYRRRHSKKARVTLCESAHCKWMRVEVSAGGSQANIR
jgi:hypothetical protein